MSAIDGETPPTPDRSRERPTPRVSDTRHPTRPPADSDAATADPRSRVRPSVAPPAPDPARAGAPDGGSPRWASARLVVAFTLSPRRPRVHPHRPAGLRGTQPTPQAASSTCRPPTTPTSNGGLDQSPLDLIPAADRKRSARPPPTPTSSPRYKAFVACANQQASTRKPRTSPLARGSPQRNLAVLARSRLTHPATAGTLLRRHQKPKRVWGKRQKRAASRPPPGGHPAAPNDQCSSEPSAARPNQTPATTMSACRSQRAARRTRRARPALPPRRPLVQTVRTPPRHQGNPGRGRMAWTSCPAANT